MTNDKKIDYGNWVSRRLIYVPAGMVAICLGLSLLSRWFLIGAAVFAMLLIYFIYAYRKFSPRGGDVQSKVRELVVKFTDWDGKGKAIDIGCGNGALAIAIAKRYAGSQITGIDYWGQEWDYAREQCERNAAAEGTAGQLTFKKASALSLPFPDESFDLAVSNLVFHEVNDAKDKRQVIKEALRVVKKGGKFAFQDLFLMKKIYGEPEELTRLIKSWGVEKVEFVHTCDSDFIPGPLQLSFMLGAIGVIHGTK
jgi:SAM-dependent methyltransferase